MREKVRVCRISVQWSELMCAHQAHPMAPLKKAKIAKLASQQAFTREKFTRNFYDKNL